MDNPDNRSALKKLIDMDEFREGKYSREKTESLVFDGRTMESIYKLFKDFDIKYIDYPISSGKESVVFKAEGQKKSYVMKIFKTSTLRFHNIRPYIEGDPRFAHYRKTGSNIVHIWVRKEYANLLECREHDINSPVPMGFMKNVLLMSFIGTKVSPAPKLKDVPEEKREAYLKDAMLQYRKMVQEAKIVHSDLSEYNVLCHRNRSYLIDMGQAVSIKHPMSRQFMERDIHVMRSFALRNQIEFDERWVPVMGEK